MALIDEMVGKKYGMLTALEKRSHGRILLQCDCGFKVIKNASNVRHGHTTNCGQHRTPHPDVRKKHDEWSKKVFRYGKKSKV